MLAWVASVCATQLLPLGAGFAASLKGGHGRRLRNAGDKLRAEIKQFIGAFAAS